MLRCHKTEWACRFCTTLRMHEIMCSLLTNPCIPINHQPLKRGSESLIPFPDYPIALSPISGTFPAPWIRRRYPKGGPLRLLENRDFHTAGKGLPLAGRRSDMFFLALREAVLRLGVFHWVVAERTSSPSIEHICRPDPGAFRSCLSDPRNRITYRTHSVPCETTSLLLSLRTWGRVPCPDGLIELEWYY